MVEGGGLRTPYRRAGEGPPVLFLAPDSTGDDPPAAFVALARHFRVFAPDLPHPGSRGGDPVFHSWLHHLVDALGLVRPGLVADPVVADPVLAFAASDPERVGRVVILRRAGDPGHAERTPDEGIPVAPPYLMVLDWPDPERAGAPGAALDGMVRFLRGS